MGYISMITTTIAALCMLFVFLGLPFLIRPKMRHPKALNATDIIEQFNDTYLNTSYLEVTSDATLTKQESPIPVDESEDFVVDEIVNLLKFANTRENSQGIEQLTRTHLVKSKLEKYGEIVKEMDRFYEIFINYSPTLRRSSNGVRLSEQEYEREFAIQMDMAARNVKWAIRKEIKKKMRNVVGYYSSRVERLYLAVVNTKKLGGISFNEPFIKKLTEIREKHLQKGLEPMGQEQEIELRELLSLLTIFTLWDKPEQRDRLEMILMDIDKIGWIFPGVKEDAGIVHVTLATETTTSQTTATETASATEIAASDKTNTEAAHAPRLIVTGIEVEPRAGESSSSQEY